MKDKDLKTHSVCTPGEAADLVKTHTKFWVSDCDSRNDHQGKSCSQLDICLFFKPDKGETVYDLREVDREFAEDILKEAKSKHLVILPFSEKSHPDVVLGIGFCCSDCCSKLLDRQFIRDRGRFIESTDRDACIACGSCLDVCYFGVRTITDNELDVDRSRCYGCGLCQTVCPMHCIHMIPREEEDG